MSSRLLHSVEKPILVRGARVVGAGLPDAPVRDVLLRGGKIEAVAESIPPSGSWEEIDGRNGWLVPGWIDIQVNDVAWHALGAKSRPETAARAREVARWQAERGVTGLVLATLASPLDDVLSYLRGLGDVLLAPASPCDLALLGALVEGTFMNPQLSGAQNPAWVLKPERAVLDRLLDTGAVRLINIAPEMAPEAIELIRHATQRGAVVGAGHAKPHAERLREAVDAGLKYAIHLGNGPTGSSLKAFHDGGMLEEVLRNDRITASVILDGWHVHPALVRDWIHRKEHSRVILTSDSGFAMGAPAGEFQVFGIRGSASPNGEFLQVLREGGGGGANPLSSDAAPLFGSAVGLREVFENAINLLTRDVPGVYHRRHDALGLATALEAAAAMCSSNPARLLSLEARGDLEPGSRSDAVLLGLSGAPGTYRVTPRLVCLS